MIWGREEKSGHSSDDVAHSWRVYFEAAIARTWGQMTGSRYCGPERRSEEVAA